MVPSGLLLVYATDADSEAFRWLCFRATRQDLDAFLVKKLTLQGLIQNAPEYFLLDMRKEWRALSKEALPMNPRDIEISEEARKPHLQHVHESPSGRYRLVVDHYRGPTSHCWGITRGQVFFGDKLCAEIVRNFDTFPFAWAEDHPTGHDYLIAGWHYQGQTVIELDTGRRVDSEVTGYEFCWSFFVVSPQKDKIVVDGFFWGVCDEIVVVDFTDPMKLPFPLLAVKDLDGTLGGWEDNETVKIFESEEKVLLAVKDMPRPSRPMNE